jgi:hypothetical protein
MAPKKKGKGKKDKKKKKEKTTDTAAEGAAGENAEELKRMIDQAVRLKNEIKREQDDFNDFQQQRVL